MSCNPTVLSETVVAENTNTYLAKIIGSDASIMAAEDCESVRIDLYEIDGEDSTPVDLTGTEITDGSAADEPDPEDLFSELQTDSRWTKDSTGFNFAYKIAAPAKSKLYECRYKITQTNGDIIADRFQLDSK